MANLQISATVTKEELEFYHEAAGRAGLSMAALVKLAVAAYTNMPPTIRRAGVRTNAWGLRRLDDLGADRTEKMMAMVAEGHTLAAVGKVFGVSRQRVQQILSGEDYLPSSRLRAVRNTIDKRIVRYTRPDRMAFAAVKRFWARVDKSSGTYGCWNWTGAVGAGGRYGNVKATYITGRDSDTAHRVAFYLANGFVPGGREENKMVCHTCNNPICCNPAHLYLGNGKTNAADRKVVADLRGR